MVALLAASTLLGGCGRQPTSPSVTLSGSPTWSAAPTRTSQTPTSPTLSPASSASPAQLPVSSSPAASPTATFEVPQRGASAPPWGAVGPGWFLVQEDLATLSVADVTSSPGAETLWLVDPHGSRYLVLQWSADRAPEAALVAWSSDARRALFAGNGEVASVDLMNDTVEAFAVPNLVAAGYTRPSGANIVALSDDPATDPNEQAGVLRRFGMDGVIESVLASDVSILGYPLPRWVYSRDGAVVYLPGAGGVRAVSNAGGQARQLDTIEASTMLCSPVRLWDTHTILVSCDESPGPRLWLAPDNGGTATALTKPAGIDRATSGTDWGSFDAVRAVSGQIFVQRPGACGGVDIATLDASGHAHQLAIPRSLGSDWLIGSAGNRIAVLSTTSENCYPRGWFGFYDPVAHATQQVINDLPNQIGAVAAVAFDF